MITNDILVAQGIVGKGVAMAIEILEGFSMPAILAEAFPEEEINVAVDVLKRVYRDEIEACLQNVVVTPEAEAEWRPSFSFTDAQGAYQALFNIEGKVRHIASAMLDFVAGHEVVSAKIQKAIAAAGDDMENAHCACAVNQLMRRYTGEASGFLMYKTSDGNKFLTPSFAVYRSNQVVRQSLEYRTKVALLIPRNVRWQSRIARREP